MGLSDFSDSQAVAEPDDEKLDLTITQTCLSESVRSETLQPKKTKQNKTKNKTDVPKYLLAGQLHTPWNTDFMPKI